MLLEESYRHFTLSSCIWESTLTFRTNANICSTRSTILDLTIRTISFEIWFLERIVTDTLSSLDRSAMVVSTNCTLVRIIFSAFFTAYYLTSCTHPIRIYFASIWTDNNSIFIYGRSWINS